MKLCVYMGGSPFTKNCCGCMYVEQQIYLHETINCSWLEFLSLQFSDFMNNTGNTRNGSMSLTNTNYLTISKIEISINSECKTTT